MNWLGLLRGVDIDELGDILDRTFSIGWCTPLVSGRGLFGLFCLRKEDDGDFCLLPPGKDDVFLALLIDPTFFGNNLLGVLNGVC